MNRLDYWKAKLKAAQADERQRNKEYNQMARAWGRAVDRLEMIEGKIEKIKLARAK